MRPTDSLSNLFRMVIALTIGLVALLALDSDRAHAAVFCVNKPNCVGTSKPTIDDALVDAQLNGSTDHVFIGAKASPYTDGNGFSYVSNEAVHIHGAGIEETTLEATSFSHSLTILSPTSTVEDMTLKIPAMSNGTGLRWDGTASNIQMEQDAEAPVASVLGSVPEGNAVLEDSSISVKDGYAIRGQNVTSATIRDTEIRSEQSGVTFNGNGASMSVRRVSVRAPRGGFSAGANQNLTIENSLIKLAGGGNPADAAITSSNGSNVVATHTTVVGSGHQKGFSVGATTNPTSLTISNSIVAGFEHPLYRLGSGAPANMGVSYSSYDAATVYSQGDGALTTGAGNLTNFTPEFRIPIVGDYRLVAPSPLIDAANPNSPTTEDLDGNPREVDGDGAGGPRADMGALEYGYQAPTAVLGGPVGAQAGTPVDFSSSGSSDPDGEALTRSWDFGDGTSGQGKDAQHAFAAAGAYTVTLTVTDPAGRTATDSAAIQVSPVPAGPGGDPNGQPPENQQPEQGATELSDLRVTPKRIRVGSATPRLVRGKRGGRIEFRLTAEATVTLRFQRSAGGGAKSIAVDAQAGANSVRFQGRVNARRALKAGRYTVAASVPGGAPLSASFTIVGGAR